MRQTAPRQMMVNGHLHQVQDLESFNKLRSQENSRQASVAAQTSGPLSRLPMSAEQAQQKVADERAEQALCGAYCWRPSRASTSSS